MKYIMEHYGPAVLAGFIFLALGALIVALLANDGAIATEFTNAISGFFTQMRNAAGV